jgi:lipopolysaccharide export LptBFGC system permease protein LptF
MWRLHRYYLREVLVNAGITFLVLFAVMFVSLIQRGIQRSQGSSDPLDAVKITLLFALDSFQHLLTISLLIGTVLAFTRAAMDRELTAIRAAGVSPRVPMMAAVLVGLFLTAVGSFALHYVIPEVHYRKYRVIAEVLRNVILSLKLDGDRLPVLDTGYVLTFQEQKDGEFRDCTLYSPKPLPGMKWPIAFVDSVPVPPIDEQTVRVEFALKGVSDPFGENRVRSLSFALPLRELAGRRSRQDSDDDVRSDQLLAEIIRGVHPRPDEATYTLFRRCCFAVMPLLFAPIGYCIGEASRTRGRVVALMLALVPLAVFYLGEVLGARLLLSTQNPWCGWLPAALLAVVAVPLCWRQLRR